MSSNISSGSGGSSNNNIASGSGSGIRPLKNPAEGSANPSASLASLWNYLEPALHHILCAPTNTPGKAPAVDVSYHVGIHTAVYNYFTMLSDSPPVYVTSKSSGKARDLHASGTDLYQQLDRFFADIAKESLLGVPHDDAALIAYYAPRFHRYTTGVQSINRLLNYVNRHYVRRSVDEDKGWLRVADVIDPIMITLTPQDTREKLSTKLKDRRLGELRKWGYEEGDSLEAMAAAEACAETASPLDRVVSVVSLGHRRWRTEVIEPLLSVPKVKGKRKGKGPPPAPNADRGPKGRLARAVKELIEGPDAQDPNSIDLAVSLADSLRICGVRTDHPLRKKLDKFVASHKVG